MSIRSPRDTWDIALGSLQVQVSAAAYDTWLRDSQGLSFDGEEFVVGVPNAFVAEWLQRRMRSLLERTLTDLLRQPVRIVVHVTDPVQTAMTEALGGADPGPVPTPAAPRPQSNRPFLSLGHAPDPRLTFESFVVGASTKLAYAAASAVANQPGQVYNPLFLYGPPGLGKTHLLHALAHEAAAHERTTLLATTEEFVNDFVSSVRERRTDEFRARYRSPDVLILDDVQFICGKERSEESLFHTCNSLLRAGKQVVLASDRAPDELPFVHRRLFSRFQAGLLVDIRPPDYSTRLAILGFKAARAPVEVPEEVLHYLAARPYPNVRQLEGELTKVIAFSTLLGQPLSLELARQALAPDVPMTPQTPPSPEALLQAIAAYYHVSADALAGKSRERSITRARQMAMYLLRTQTSASLEQIGRLLGGRDHTTVLHGVQKIEGLSSTDGAVPEAQAAILHILSSRLHRS
jgi:chromosomal replication initiator protein